jgi:hypothetical protein
MASTPEKLVKDQIKKCLDKYENLWYFFPVASRYSAAGTPDIIGTYQGKFFGIEVKAKGKPTALQLRAIAAIIAAGGRAGIVKPSTLLSIDQQVRNLLECPHHSPEHI